MYYITPDGPIDKLREEMIAMMHELVKKMPAGGSDYLLFVGEIIPKLRNDDQYLRYQARRFVRLAERYGIAVKVTRH